MNVGGVAVVILVLNEAGEAVELGKESAEDAEFMHVGEGGVDLAEVLDDGEETARGVGVALGLRG